MTSGDGYDYQPDWSPDGRHVVYATYRKDAVELWLLDLTSGAAGAIVAQGAVNVDPRWSPGGSRSGASTLIDQITAERLGRDSHEWLPWQRKDPHE